MTTTSKIEVGILEAIERKDIEKAAALIEQGADVHTVSANGWTPLMLAVLFDLRPVVKALLLKGANPNQRTRSEENPSRTALLVAINNTRVEVLELLLQRGAEVSAPVHGEANALEWARRFQKRTVKQPKMSRVVALLESYSKSA